MDTDHLVTNLRTTLRSHGYSATTMRSYSFYVKDFLGWASAQQSKAKSVTLRNALVRYGMHLKDERKLGGSSISQGMSAVSFLLRHVLAPDGLPTLPLTDETITAQEENQVVHPEANQET